MLAVPAPIFNLVPRSGAVRIVGFTRKEEVEGYNHMITMLNSFHFFQPVWATQAWSEKFKLAAIMQSQIRRLYAVLDAKGVDMPEMTMKVGEPKVIAAGIKDQLGQAVPCKVGDAGVLFGINQELGPMGGAALTPEQWSVEPATIPDEPDLRAWKVTFHKPTPKSEPKPPTAEFPNGIPSHDIPYCLFVTLQDPESDKRLNSQDTGELLITVVPAEVPVPTRKAYLPMR